MNAPVDSGSVAVEQLTRAFSSGEPPNQVLLVHSGVREASIPSRLGTADYSYYFVLNEFRPALERLGCVIEVEDPVREVDGLHRICRERGVPCTFLSFSPPHKTPLGLVCPTIPVFAWEFTDIPNEVFDDDPRSDWTAVLGRLGWAITHSRFAAAVVKAGVRADFPVTSVPAPVWNRFEELRAGGTGWNPDGGHERTIGGTVIDSREIDLAPFASRRVKRELGLPPEDRDPPPLPQREGVRVDPENVVYTAVFNPYDDRKNWMDLVGVFCQTLRDADDVTLILKLTHYDPWQACYFVLEELYKNSPFRCRVLIQHGFLSAEEYRQLIRVSDYAVNASHGEGQCLPIMEFMSAGRPAIAPGHTAFADYLTPSNAFLVDSTVEPAAWPHDPRQLFRTRRYRINPETLAEAYWESYQVATLDRDRYRRMSTAAAEDLRRHCSVGVAVERLKPFLAFRRTHESMFRPEPRSRRTVARLESSWESLAARRGTVDPPADRAVRAVSASEATGPGIDPRVCGLKDARRTGWYRAETGEVVEGFAITPEDRVLDMGCGAGAATHFCARAGASVVFADIRREKVALASDGLSGSHPERHLPLVCDAEAIPIGDDSVTKVISIDVLEHLSDPARALREMARIGRPGAEYLLTVPDPVGERLQQELAPARHFQPPNHIHIFEREGFAEMVTEAGLTVERHTWSGFYWALAMCLHWVADRDTDGTHDPETLSQLRPPYPEVLHRWAETWDAFLGLPASREAKGALDRFLPKNQILIARKPHD